jgi:hypothetical protein
MNKISLKKLWKEYWLELLTTALFLIILLNLLFNSKFNSNIITNFILFRPENTIIIFIILCGLVVVFGSLFFAQMHPKTLKSTKKLSSFAQALNCTDVCKESITQTPFLSYRKSIVNSFNAIKNEMPIDINKSNSHIIDLVFEYEERLNI